MLLSVQDLSVRFYMETGVVSAVEKVSFNVRSGSSFGIVGESGSGKTVTALTIMGLLPSPPGRIDSGRILFKGEDLLVKEPDKIRRLRQEYRDDLSRSHDIHEPGPESWFPMRRGAHGPRQAITPGGGVESD